MFPLGGHNSKLYEADPLPYIMDNTILEDLGLTPGEIKTYLALLKLKSSSTGPLEKEAGVSRSKLYGIIDKLEKKGLASEIEQNGVKYFQAADPIRIKELFKERERRLKDLETEFDNFLPALESLQKETDGVHKVSVHQGIKGLTAVHEYMYQKLKRGDTYYSIGIPSTQPQSHHLFWQRDHERRAQAGIRAKLLFNNDVAPSVLKNRNSYRGCDARYMPLDVSTPAYFEIYADTVMIVIPTINPVVIEIVSAEIAASFKAYFEKFWSLSKPFRS
jgi:sugar-specific transcriptional regulator TrmB